MALSAEDGYGAIQLGGLVKVPVSGGEVQAGWIKLSADGSGGVKSLETGKEYWVVASDETAQTVTVLL